MIEKGKEVSVVLNTGKHFRGTILNVNVALAKIQGFTLKIPAGEIYFPIYSVSYVCVGWVQND